MIAKLFRSTGLAAVLNAATRAPAKGGGKGRPAAAVLSAPQATPSLTGVRQAWTISTVAGMTPAPRPATPTTT